MKRVLFILPLLLFEASSLQATEINTTAVNQALKRMLNPSGKFTTIEFADGTSQTSASSASVAFSEVTGSATASQLPLISGLIGSATSTQLPAVLRLSGTSTEQAANAAGQLYTLTSIVGTVPGSFGTLTTASLVSYYKLEDLTDNFGANTLTNYGATTFVAGKYGTCATFNGTSQYLQTSVLSTQTTNISMFGWVYIASASEARPFFNNGIDGADTNGYALGVGNTNFENAGNNLVGQVHGVFVFNFAVAIGTGWHHVGMTRDATTWRGYIDKVQCATTFTNNPVTPSGNFTIGRNYNGGAHWYYNNKIDDVVFYNKCLSAGEINELYNNTGSVGMYTEYNMRYVNPVNGTTIFQIKTPGTVTTKASVIAFNATHTIFGSTTSLYSPAGQSGGTDTIYSVDASNRNVLGVYYTPSEETLKVVRPYKKVNRIEEMKQLKIDEWSWQIRDVNRLDAEAKAKEEFVKVTLSEQNYEVITNNNGSITVTINKQRMNSDLISLKNDKELEWASTLEQANLIDSKEDEMESGQERYLTPFAGDITTPAILQDSSKKTLNINSQIGYAYETIQEMIDMLGSLTAALENQKVAYNEEVDNIYNLINAIIVALLAVGGISGWTTIRRKRKGT